MSKKSRANANWKKNYKAGAPGRVEANRKRRLERHMKNHPNDEQSQKILSKGNLKPRGAKKRSSGIDFGKDQAFIEMMGPKVRGGRLSSRQHEILRNRKMEKAVANEMQFTQKRRDLIKRVKQEERKIREEQRKSRKTKKGKKK